MKSKASAVLGTQSIPHLIFKQALPAAMGFLVMSVYGIVDTYFVGNYVGSIAIAAITIVIPVTFLISSFGMVVGIGGASIISRALGVGDFEKAERTFGNQMFLTLSVVFVLLIGGFFLEEQLLKLFGANEAIMPSAKEYFRIVLAGVPFLAWSMMSNNVIRAQGKPKMAMLTLAIPAVLNLILDPLFIVVFDWGIEGAALATTISYIASAVYTLYFLTSKNNEIKVIPKHIQWNGKVTKEIFSIGGVSFARQAAISLFAIVINNTLDNYGGEDAITAYGIVNRFMLFAIFPLIGLVQGFLPIVGYNVGSNQPSRVRETILYTNFYGIGVSTVIFGIIWFLSYDITSIFTTDKHIVEMSSIAMFWIFSGLPITIIQLTATGYYQALGKTKPAYFLTVAKPLLFQLPLVIIFARMYQLDGIWYAFPVADILTTAMSVIFILREVRRLDQIILRDKGSSPTETKGL